MRKLRISRKVLAFLLILVLVVFTAFEVYAHTYVPHLSVTSEERALDYMWWGTNGTQIFHREFGYCSVDWLFALCLGDTIHNVNFFFIFIFKVSSSGSPLVQDLEIVPLRLQTTYLRNNRTEEGGFLASVYDVLHSSNCTCVRVDSIIGSAGIYDVTFNLSIKVYAKTLLGYLSIEDTTISMNVTMTYWYK